MKVKIVVLGSINYDIVARTYRLPNVGETVNGTGIDMYVGGKGSNQAVQTAMLGALTYFIGNVGKDEQGTIVRNALKSKGVDTTFLNISNNYRTGCASIYIDEKGDNMLVYAAGANMSISKKTVDAAIEVIKNAHVLITQNEINYDAIVYGLKLAKSFGVTTILNPAPAIPLDVEVLQLVDYITPNETEAEKYTGLLRKNTTFDHWKRESANWFLKHGVKNVCITLGEKGSYFYNGDEEFYIEAFPINPKDTTAAGDAFNGGFAYGIANNWPISKCLLLGNACGALASLTVGAQNSICSMHEVETFLEQMDIYL